MGATCGSSKCPCSSHGGSSLIGEDHAGPRLHYLREDDIAVKTLGTDDPTWRGDWCSCSNPAKHIATGSSITNEKPSHSDGSTQSTREATSNTSETPPQSNRTDVPGFPTTTVPRFADSVAEECSAAKQESERAHQDHAATHDTTSTSPGSKNQRLTHRILDPLTHSMSLLTSSHGPTRKKSRKDHKDDEEPLRPPSGNANRPQDYVWLEATLRTIVRNEAASLGCMDLAINKEYIPVFVVMGGCPNMFCGMQAVMYYVARDGEVDFWWVKPDKRGCIESETLHRHSKGAHKNDPGRSKPFYKPLADLFSGAEQSSKPGTSFGIERINHSDGSDVKTLRAYIDQEVHGRIERFYIFCVWQEDWSTGVFSKKYIKGKIIYQKHPESNEYFSRQYNIANSQLSLSEREDPVFDTIIPGDAIKELRGVD